MITPIRKTAQSGDSNCPGLYRDGDSFIVVGKRVDDPDALAGLQYGVGDDELAVRVPADVLTEVVAAGH